MPTVAILGSGAVGERLAGGFLKHGYEVVIGTRDPAKHAQSGKPKNPALAAVKVTTYDDAARAGNLAVLATKGTVAESVVRSVASHLAGKVVMDATNPIADLPPQNGVLKFFTTFDESLMERLQRAAPDARLVKAFSCVGNALMVNPDFGGVRPTMFICGNDLSAKQEVAAILDQFGHEVEDLGGVEAARAIEPLCILWCIPGFLRNEWSHAFKLLRK